MKKMNRKQWKWKVFWKKYQVVIGIELFTVFIMICWAGMIFQMKRELKINEVSALMNEAPSWYDSYNRYEHGNSSGELLEYLLQQFPKKEGRESYGLAVEFYNKNGDVILQTGSRNLILIWETERELVDQNGVGAHISDYKEVILLENHFSEETLDQFLDFYHYEGQYEEEKPDGLTDRILAVKWMTGYYNEQNEYIPVKIMFMDDNQREIEFLLENKENEAAGQKSGTYETVVNKSGNPILIDYYLWDTREEVSEEVWTYFQKAAQSSPQAIVLGQGGGGGSAFDRAFYSGNIEGELYEKTVYEAAGYAFASYADVDDLTLHHSDLQYDIRNMIFLCQAGALILMLVYLYFQKKQREMRRMHDTFLNAMAHEMKTPAAVMKNSIECIQAGVHPEKQIHYQDMICQEADHLNQLLEQMLTYTRMNDTFYQIKQEDCDLKSLAEKICGYYASFIEEKKITLYWSTEEAGIFCCDPCLMEMVLDNFISNAVKFCTDGGVIRITIKGRSFCIYNEGKHIPAEHKKTIWEPLFKTDTSRNADGEFHSDISCMQNSSGMGLAVSASVLELHHAGYGSRNVQGGVEFYFEMA